MLNPHYIKVYTHLGIHKLPIESSIGVEKAPDKILSDKFLTNLNYPETSEFKFSQQSSDLYQTILKESLELRNLISKKIKENETVIVIGGDHSITFPSILADLERFGTNIGVIHFDSHADFNLFKTSPSENFHGMYLRIFFDKYDLPFFENAVPNKIPLSNLIFIGDLELDSEESNFIRNNKLNTVSSLDMENSKNKVLDQLKIFVEKHKHIHISFDVDVFRKEIASATTTPSQNGFSRKPIFEILSIIKNAKSITLDIAEINPEKKGAEQTIKLAQKVIYFLLS